MAAGDIIRLKQTIAKLDGKPILRSLYSCIISEFMLFIFKTIVMRIPNSISSSTITLLDHSTNCGEQKSFFLLRIQLLRSTLGGTNQHSSLHIQFVTSITKSSLWHHLSRISSISSCDMSFTEWCSCNLTSYIFPVPSYTT